MRIVSVTKALPPHYYDQEALLRALVAHWRRIEPGRRLDRLESLHRKVLVGGRYLARPIDDYSVLDDWGKANDAWIESAERLAETAVRSALADSGVDPATVGALLMITTTGVATPSIDARILNKLDIPRDVRRMPLFGLGCAGGAAGLARASDFVKAFPHKTAIVVSVELCSLTLQSTDLSVANLIASGLFGDGAAAAVVAGEAVDVGRATSPAGPRVVATRSSFYPDTLDVMGWHVDASGFKVVLSPEVPEMVRRHLGDDVDRFLADHDLVRSDVASWVCHPGGPRVIEALIETLDLTNGELDLTWRSLREIGNVSSASVLYILADTIASRRPDAGSPGLLLAMGPGFGSELLLLEW